MPIFIRNIAIFRRNEGRKFTVVKKTDREKSGLKNVGSHSLGKNIKTAIDTKYREDAETLESTRKLNL